MQQRTLVAPGDLPAPAYRCRSADLLAGRLCFLGETHQQRREEPWLEEPGTSSLFRGELHGLEWLRHVDDGPEGDAFVASTVASWLAHHAAVGAGAAFEPSVVAVRLLSLMALGQRPGMLEAAGGAARFLSSLRSQALWLREHAGELPPGKQRLAGAVALAVAGSSLEESELELFGMGRLERACSRQVLADGGHVEGCYGQHLRVMGFLELVERVRERVGRPPLSWLAGARARMDGWARAMTSGLREPPLFGDSWASAALPAQAAGAEPADDLLVLPASGFVRLRWGRPGDVMLLRYGRPGPEAGVEAHADAGSFELFVDGRRFFGDSGAPALVPGVVRGYGRHMLSHNVAWGDAMGQAGVHVDPAVGDASTCRLLSHGREEGMACVWLETVPAPSALPGQTMRRRVLVVPDEGVLIEDILVVDGVPFDELRDVCALLHAPPGADLRPAQVHYGDDADGWRVTSGATTMYVCPLPGRSGPLYLGPSAAELGVSAEHQAAGVTAKPRVCYMVSPLLPTRERRQRFGLLCSEPSPLYR